LYSISIQFAGLYGFFSYFSALLFATILGNVTNILEQINAPSQKFFSHLRAIRAFAELHNLPPKLTEAICDYVTFKSVVTHGIEAEEVIMLNYR